MTGAPAAPLLVSTRAELDDVLAPRRRSGQRVALVPTMGALHAGHASLMQVAREHAGAGPVAVAVFVNPLQFAPGEDLDRYPRTLEADLDLCRREGVDIVFAPAVEEVYPSGVAPADVEAMVSIAPGPLATVLEGASRPTHFRGVLTVVAKLLGLVRPDVAVFGEKDYQQLVLVRQMAADLCLPTHIVGAPTHRADDGLALSSRNAFLDGEQREQAAALRRALAVGVDQAAYGPRAVLDAARAELSASPGVDLDYLALTSPSLGDLPDDPPAGTPARILVAARVGPTRLIDNLPLELGSVTTTAEGTR